MRKVLIALGTLAVALTVAYSVAIGAALRSAPLIDGPITSQPINGEMVVGLELNNRSALPLTLASLLTSGPQPQESVSLVSFPDERTVISAAAVAVNPGQAKYQEGPITGFQVGRTVGANHKSYGLRMTWPAGERLPESITIKYRYLGYPLERQIPLCGASGPRGLSGCH